MKINLKNALDKQKAGEAVFIDTRTPQEFSEDHLPDAINLPILSNEERAIVGTIYKRVSQQEAVDKGIEFFSKKLPDFIKEINKYTKPNQEQKKRTDEKKTDYSQKEIIIYCWRGGMRSGAITALLNSLKYNVWQLEGGYKAYRAYVREKLENFVIKPKIIVLWGLTCSGKTELLQHLPNTLDLEGLAQHRGSLYGAIGLKPSSQKKFDNLFLQRLEQLNDQRYIITEGESRKIGDVQIPLFFYKAMLKGTNILVKRSIAVRAKESVREYFNSNKAITEIKKITLSLSKIISKNRKAEIVELLDKKKYQEAARILLEEYYDPLYGHTLDKKQYAFEVNNDVLEEAVKTIREKIIREKK